MERRTGSCSVELLVVDIVVVWGWVAGLGAIGLGGSVDGGSWGEMFYSYLFFARDHYPDLPVGAT